MVRRLLLFNLLFFPLVSNLVAQDTGHQLYRTIDGSFNNLENPRWGAAGDNLQRLTDVGYADGISAPGGVDRPSPREISNAIFAQDGLINDPLNLSDFTWVFGQFLDHDLGLTPDGPEPMFIEVPKGDPWFDPQGSGLAVIPMQRNLFDRTTGTGPDNPRQHPNIITAYIDGSAVYGSSEADAAWLRTFAGGKLKVSAGNMLPFNTTTGEFGAPIDPSAPHMDNPVGLTDKLFVAGDPRANENPLLLSFHTLFVREHNRLCDELATEHPDWSDEQLYQHARKLVGGTLQSIVFNEWLPTMGVKLPPYQGYRPEVNPQLANVFTAAAFRLGHTLLNGQLLRIKADGEPVEGGPVGLRDAFFNPLLVMEEGGIDVFLQGMAAQTQQSMDAKVIDDVRNFLFGPPGAGGLDLPAININRGRERGLPDFNTVRRNYGLEPYFFFQQISVIPQTVVRLNSLYKSINNIDPWVGMLAETPMPHALFGQTLMTILRHQFTALRDGDRFFYLNDPVLSDAEKAALTATNMHDIIMRNTGIKLMQENVFEAMPHSMICTTMDVEVTGTVRTAAGEAVQNVEVIFRHAETSEMAMTDDEGFFHFDPVPGCEVREVRLQKNGDPANGLSTIDLILIQKHLLGVVELDSPYKLIAADANLSGNISTLDIVVLRKIILGRDLAFEHGQTWRFIPAAYEFIDPAHPFDEDFPEGLEFNLLGDDLQVDYVAVKIGDVNASVRGIEAYAGTEIEVREDKDNGLDLLMEDRVLQPGESVTVEVSAAAARRWQGYEFSLAYDAASLAFEGIAGGRLPGLSEGNFGVFQERGLLTTSWHDAAAVELAEGEVLFALRFRALRPGRLRDRLHQSDVLPGAAFGETLEGAPLRIGFTPSAATPSALQLALYQNQPNPFYGQTIIPFSMPAAGQARLTVYDAAGRILLTRAGDFGEGMNQWEVQRAEVAGDGILYYRLETDFGTATRKMIAVRP